jgi:hypothetical protein
MIRPATALACAAMILTASLASAEPILKPHKYYGPIPQSAMFLRLGMLGGATNEEMIAFQDGKIQSPFEGVSEDFGNGLVLEAGYMYKPHPRFGVRLNASYAALRSSATGNMVAQATGIPDTIPLPVLDFSREFNVDLIVVEASGVYYFADASVKDFQTYLGGGFSFGFPHESYQETRVDADTGEPYGDAIDDGEWGFSAGVHAVLGAMYYTTNRFAISAEARVQLLEGRFDQLETPNEVGDLEEVSFVVDYSGFYVTLGVAWAF